MCTQITPRVCVYACVCMCDRKVLFQQSMGIKFQFNCSPSFTLRQPYTYTPPEMHLFLNVIFGGVVQLLFFNFLFTHLL